MAMRNYLHALRKIVLIAMAGFVICAFALGSLMVTNSAGVRAGITGIVYNKSANSIGVDYVVVDPVGTNVTKFMIQSSLDLQTWTNLTPTITLTGSGSGEASDFASPQAKFYRMYLVNFQ